MSNIIIPVEDEPAQIPRPKLVHATHHEADFWIRDFLNEARNGISAHMELYPKGDVEGVNGGNPGQWDPESSWGALQRVIDELALYTYTLCAPVPDLTLPYNLRACRWVLRDYMMVSKKLTLVRSGYATQGYHAKYAKLLTTMMSTIVHLLNPPQGKPEAVWALWQRQKFL